MDNVIKDLAGLVKLLNWKRDSTFSKILEKNIRMNEGIVPWKIVEPMRKLTKESLFLGFI